MPEPEALEPPARRQMGWRILAGVMSAAVVVALGLDVARGHLGLHDVAPVIALVPMLLFAVGGQRLLGRALPLFRR